MLRFFEPKKKCTWLFQKQSKIMHDATVFCVSLKVAFSFNLELTYHYSKQFSRCLKQIRYFFVMKMMFSLKKINLLFCFFNCCCFFALLHHWIYCEPEHKIFLIFLFIRHCVKLINTT